MKARKAIPIFASGLNSFGQFYIGLHTKGGAPPPSVPGNELVDTDGNFLKDTDGNQLSDTQP